MAMLRKASEEYDYKLNLAEIARIWKGGCIIRSRILDPIKDAFTRKRKLAEHPRRQSLQEGRQEGRARLAPRLRHGNRVRHPDARDVRKLAYFDGYRAGRLPANLTQAQRDYFGAHTYQRTDREGTFHTEWMK